LPLVSHFPHSSGTGEICHSLHWQVSVLSTLLVYLALLLPLLVNAKDEMRKGLGCSGNTVHLPKERGLVSRKSGLLRNLKIIH
jgi:hypothetical protein